MKNLKRALSFALASVMLIGMMVVGAGAAEFTDADKIVNDEAVQTMVALGVLAGKEDGSWYDPNGTVTREEMAKIVAVMLNGGKDITGVTKPTPTFSDIDGNWAEGYIEYCYNLGIIAGRGDGTFDPKAIVTGTEAAKMFLVALGYDADVFEFTGNSWAISVNSKANEVDLYNEIEHIDPSAGLTRDNAAQMAYNTLEAFMMTRTYDKVLSNGEISYNYSLDTSTNFLLAKFKVYVNYGQLTDISKGNLTIVDDTDYAYRETGTDTSFSKVGTDYTEYLGQTVKVMYKSPDQVVGVAPVSGNTVYETAMSAIENNNGKAKFGGTSYTLDYAENKTNAVRILTIESDGSGITDNATGTAANLVNTSSYDHVSLIDNNGDGKIEYAVVKEYAAGKVTYLGDEETIVAGETYSLEDDIVDEALVKGGYAVASYNLFTDNYTVTALEEETGALSVNNAESKYRVDGTWYFKGTGTLTKSDAGKDVDYYAYNGVIVNIKLSEAVTIDNVVMVLDTDSGSVDNRAKILLPNGNKQIVAVSDDSPVALGSLAKGKLYTMEETDNGYEFTAAATFGTGDSTYTWDGTGVTLRDADNDGSDDGSKTVATVHDGSATAAPIADSAIVFVWDGAENGKIITGKQLKTLKSNSATAAADQVHTASNGIYTSKVEGLDRVSVIAVKGHSTLPTVGVDGKLYGLIVSAAIKADEDYLEYTVWTGTENVVVQEKKVSAIANRTQFTVIRYSAINNGVISDVEHFTDTATPAGASTADTLYVAPVVSLSGNKLWPNNTNAAGDLDGDTAYLYYDSSTTTAANIGKAGGELSTADKALDDTTLIANVKYIADGDGDVVFVLVDTKNMVKDAKAAAIIGFAADTNTTTSNVTGLTFSKTSGVIAGEEVTLTITIGTACSETITLTNAVFGDGTTTLSVSGMAAGTYKVAVYPVAASFKAVAA